VSAKANRLERPTQKNSVKLSKPRKSRKPPVGEGLQEAGAAGGDVFEKRMGYDYEAQVELVRSTPGMSVLSAVANHNLVC